jgi:hypothetical protein
MHFQLKIQTPKTKKAPHPAGLIKSLGASQRGCRSSTMDLAPKYNKNPISLQPSPLPLALTFPILLEKFAKWE